MLKVVNKSFDEVTIILLYFHLPSANNLATEGLIPKSINTENSAAVDITKVSIPNSEGPKNLAKKTIAKTFTRILKIRAPNDQIVFLKILATTYPYTFAQLNQSHLENAYVLL